MPVPVDEIFFPDPTRLRALETDPLLQWLILCSRSQLVNLSWYQSLSQVLRCLLQQDLNILLQVFNDWEEFVTRFTLGRARTEWPQSFWVLNQVARSSIGTFVENFPNPTNLQNHTLRTVLSCFRNEVEARLDYTRLYQHQIASRRYQHPTLIQECEAFQTRLQEFRSTALQLTTESRQVVELHLYLEESQRIERQRPWLMRQLHRAAPQSLNTARQKVLRKCQERVLRTPFTPMTTLDAAYNDAIQWTRVPLNNICQQLLGRIIAAEKNLAATDPKKKAAAHLAFDKTIFNNGHGVVPCIDVSFGGSAFLIKSEGNLSYPEINSHFMRDANGAVYLREATPGSWVDFGPDNLDLTALNHFLLLRRLQERGHYRDTDRARQENNALSALERAATGPLFNALALDLLNINWFQGQAYLMLKTLPENALIESSNIIKLNDNYNRLSQNALLQNSTVFQQELVRLGVLPALSFAQSAIIAQLLEAERAFWRNLPLQPNVLAQKIAGRLAFDSDPFTNRTFITVTPSSDGYLTLRNSPITMQQINEAFCRISDNHVYSRAGIAEWRAGRTTHNPSFSPQTRDNAPRLLDFQVAQLDLDKLNQLLQLRSLGTGSLTGAYVLTAIATLPPFMRAILQPGTASLVTELKASWFRGHAYVVLQTLPATTFDSSGIRRLNTISEEILRNPTALQQELVDLGLVPPTTAPTAGRAGTATVVRPTVPPASLPTSTQTNASAAIGAGSSHTSTPQQQLAQPALSAAQLSVIAQLLLTEKTHLDQLPLQPDDVLAQKMAGRLALGADDITYRTFIDVLAAPTSSTAATDEEHAYCIKTQGDITLAEINNHFCITPSNHVYSRTSLERWRTARTSNVPLSPNTRQPLAITRQAFTSQQVDLVKLNQLLQLRRLQKQSLTKEQALTMIATLSPFMQRVLQANAAEAVAQLKAGWFQDPAYTTLQTLPASAFAVANITRLNALSDEVLRSPTLLQQAVVSLVPSAPVSTVRSRSWFNRATPAPTRGPEITTPQSSNAPRPGTNTQTTPTTTFSTTSLKTSWRSGEAARYRSQLPAGFLTATGIRFLNAIPDTVLTHTTAGVFLTNLMQQVDLQNLEEYWLQEPYISTLCTLIRESSHQPLYETVRDSNITDQDGPLITHFLARRLRLPDAQRPSLTVEWLKKRIECQHLLESVHTELSNSNSPPTTSISFPLMAMSTSNNYGQHLGEFLNTCVERRLHATNKAAVYRENVPVSEWLRRERFGKNTAAITRERERYTDQSSRLEKVITAIQAESTEYSLTLGAGNNN